MIDRRRQDKENIINLSGTHRYTHTAVALVKLSGRLSSTTVCSLHNSSYFRCSRKMTSDHPWFILTNLVCRPRNFSTCFFLSRRANSKYGHFVVQKGWHSLPFFGPVLRPAGATLSKTKKTKSIILAFTVKNVTE